MKSSIKRLLRQSFSSPIAVSSDASSVKGLSFEGKKSFRLAQQLLMYKVTVFNFLGNLSAQNIYSGEGVNRVSQVNCNVKPPDN